VTAGLAQRRRALLTALTVLDFRYPGGEGLICTGQWDPETVTKLGIALLASAASSPG
jgi:hypothetical protein